MASARAGPHQVRQGFDAANEAACNMASHAAGALCKSGWRIGSRSAGVKRPIGARWLRSKPATHSGTKPVSRHQRLSVALRPLVSSGCCRACIARICWQANAGPQADRPRSEFPVAHPHLTGSVRLSAPGSVPLRDPSQRQLAHARDAAVWRH